MAYTVGSVSVDVVPDFRNAQNAITAFFERQPDQLKVPVRPDLDTRSIAAVERQAAQVGSRVGEAIAKNASRTISQNLGGNITREIAKLERDISTARRQAEDAAAKLRVAELRLTEARNAGNRSASTMLALEQAVETQRRRGADADRVLAQSSARLIAAREELGRATAQAAEEAGRRAAEAQQKADRAVIESAHATALRMNREYDQRVRAAQQAANRTLSIAERQAAEELRIIERNNAAIEREADRAAREREKQARAEAKLAERLARDAARAAQRAIKENLRVQAQIEIDQRRLAIDSKRAGGLIARSVRAEIHQNAGLIAAAVGGALLLGAPIVLGAATTLFAGIGAVAAAQSQELRSVWQGTWNDIKAGAVSDAAVLVPAYSRMAVAIGQSFQRMRPLVRDAFEDLGPQIDVFTESLVKMGESALPAMVRAVQQGMPVMVGFGSLMQSVGTGVAGLFDNLTAHSPAAGRALSEFGEIVGELLPLIGELAGQGAEVASNVFPVLTASLSGVNSVLGLIGPALPTVLTGFLAFRAVEGVGAKLRSFGANMAFASQQGGMFASIQKRAGDAIYGIGRALPVVGIALGVVAAGFAAAEEATDNWRDALLRGGEAAATATRQTIGLENFWRSSALGAHLGFLEPLADAVGLGADAYGDAAREAHNYLQSLDPLTRAQVILERETADLAFAIEQHGPASAQATVAYQIWEAASRRVAREQAALQQATLGVTDAMVAQADSARGLADSSFAYEQALIDLEEEQANYNEVMADANATDLDRRQALLDLQTAYGAVGDKARDVALNAMPALLDANQKNILADKAQLDALLQLKEAHGDLGPILENEILELQAATGGANENALAQAQLAAALAQVGIEVENIPGTKSVRVEALTDTAIDQLEALGLKVEQQPDGSFIITAETAEAQAALNDIDTQVTNLDQRRAEVEAALDGVPFFSGASQVIGRSDEIDSQRPTPVANLDNGNFYASYRAVMGSSNTLHLQRPTPIAQLNGVPFFGTVARVMGGIVNLAAQRPTPVANAVDNATPIIGRVLSAINSIPASRTTTLTTIYREIRETVLRNIPLFGAEGGAVEGGQIFNYDSGGAVVGRGGGRDDLVRATGPIPTARYNLGNGEHIFDAGDVAMMGGQAEVYAFREALARGDFGNSAARSIMNMLDKGTSQRSRDREPANINGFVNYGTIQLRDEQEFYRRAELARRELYAQELV